MKSTTLTLVLVLAVGAAIVLDVTLGSAELGLGEVWSALWGGGDLRSQQVVRSLRLPRAILAVLVGGGLGVAGAVFQALLRNPLAEPYILGISSGAATGAVGVLVFGLVAAGSWALPLAAFAGALLAIFLVFGVAVASDQRLDVRVLLLAGVVVGAFFSAAIAFMLSISSAATVRSAVLWMMGSLGNPSWDTVAIVATYTVPSVLALIALARPLNLLALGEETATYLGTNSERVKRIAYGVASLLTAAGVAAAGVIGFVGLVVPHTLRLLIGSDYRLLLPLSFLGGAAFLTVADVVATTAFAPVRLPIGVVTAFLGVPVFLVLLRRSLGASR